LRRSCDDEKTERDIWMSLPESEGGGGYAEGGGGLSRRHPEPVRDIVDRLMANVGRGRTAPVTRLYEAWEAVVGPEFAERTRPGSCDGGRLVVLVADGSTASKLRFVSAEIVRRAAEIVGEAEVNSVSFRVASGRGR